MKTSYSNPTWCFAPSLWIEYPLPLFEEDHGFQLPEDDISHTILDAVFNSGILDFFKNTPRSYKGYDPAALLTAILLGYAETGYASTRDLAKSCRFDLRYRWLFQENTPSHMVFQRFIQNNLKEGEIEQIFKLVNCYISNQIPLDLNTIYIDGTKLEANANKFTFVWRKQAERSLHSNYAKSWKEMEKVNVFCSKNNIDYKFSPFTMPSLKNAYQAFRQVGFLCESYAAQFNYGRGKRKHPLQRAYDNLSEYILNIIKYEYYLDEMGERNSLSKTDHDASFLHMKYDYYCNTGVFKPGYNIQIGVCDGFIFNVLVNTEANDIHSYIPFMDKFYNLYGYYPENACADAGYGSYDNYLYNLSHGIESYIKYPHWERESHHRRADQYRPFRFTFDEYGILHCPEGHIMERTGNRRDYRNERIYPRFISTYTTDACQNCPVRSKCTKAAQGRKVSKTVGLDEIQSHVRDNLKSDKGQELRKQRNIQAEGTFGQIKEDYRYTRFRRRGLENVKKEFLLVAISFNLRKLHTILHREEEEAEILA